MSAISEVEYLVLPDTTNPYLLARVRWPDVFQAMSPTRPYWQDDPGLFDLPYDPSSISVTRDLAAAIAAEWGARLPTDDAAAPSESSLIRRMPADWSNLSPAEKRAWSIEETAPSRSVARSASRAGLRRWRRRRVTPAVVVTEEPASAVPTANGAAPGADPVPTNGAHVIDLTDTKEDALATAEDT